jgi:uncharacterized protein (TIGR03435 family)
MTIGGPRSNQQSARRTCSARAVLFGAAGLLIMSVLLAPLGSLAQPAVTTRPEFEVASVKPSSMHGEGGLRSRVEHSGDSVTMRNVVFSDCLMWAYQVELYQIPQRDSLDREHYDILGKAPGPAPASQLRLMLQQLMADRFKLTLHRDTKTLSMYALTVAKGGAKLPPAKADGDNYHAVERLPEMRDGSFVF